MNLWDARPGAFSFTADTNGEGQNIVVVIYIRCKYNSLDEMLARIRSPTRQEESRFGERILSFSMVGILNGSLGELCRDFEI